MNVMTPFDPYHKWLGIPPDEQPAGPHRLLGISEDENDPQVVREAALRQTAFVRQFSMGEHGEHAERILGELADARDSILNGKVESPTKPAVKPTPSPVETNAAPLVNESAATDRETPQAEPTPREDPLTFMTEELAAISSKPVTQSRSRSGKPIWKEPWAPAAGGAIALLLIMMLFGSGEEMKEPADQSTNTAQGNQQKTQPTANNEAEPDKVSVAPPLAVAPFDTTQAKQHQQAWADHLGISVVTTNSVGMKLALVPPGEFMMGSDEEMEDEKPVHKVTLTRPFQLGVYEVTQEQYEKVVGDNPSRLKGPTNPVEANWPDAIAFCSLLTDRPEEKLAGRRYRLPTEAEWEYSCRAGTAKDFSFGSDASLLTEFGWIKKNSGGRTHPVGEKKPNAWGLYDMHGNVWERCMDWKGNYPSNDLVNPQGPSDGTIRMTRGGGFLDGNRLRSATRGGDSYSSNRSSHNGFRVVCVFSGQQESAASVNATDTVELDQKSAIPADAIQFGGHHYQIVTDKVTWMQASKIAEEVGGHLLQIDSLAEYDFFVSELSSVKLGAPDTEGGHGIWIDGNRLEDGTTYRYENGQPVDFKNMGRVITNYFDYDLFLLYYRNRDGWYVGDSGIQIKRVGGTQTGGFIIEWDEDEQTTAFIPRSSLPASLQEGLIAYYPFNGNANDESGNDQHCAVRGAVLSKDRFGKPESGYSFNGVDQSISGRRLELAELFTVSVWFEFESPQTGVLVNFNNPVILGGTFATIFAHHLPNGRFRFNNRAGGGGAGGINVYADTTLNGGDWHHSVCVKDEGFLSLFIDGKLSSRIKDVTTRNAVYVNLRVGENINNLFFKGTIDDVRIYNRALSEAEVKSLYEFEKP